MKTGVGVSDEFEIRVGVYQGSALSPLLFILVMQEATREERRGLWELLYADDLVITAESEEDAINRFNSWKESLEKRGLKINIEKTKVMVTGRAPVVRWNTGRFPCSCCGRGVGSNSVLCTGCSRWCHLRCSGLRSINEREENYRCPKCEGEGRIQRTDEDAVETNGGRIQIVDRFCYLGEMLSCEMSTETAVRVRIASAWKKWKEIAGMLVNKRIPLRCRAKIYCACIRPVMLYGSETWSTTKVIENMIKRNDCRMLRYMSHVKWEDGFSNEDVMRECGVEDVLMVLRRNRLRWYGHVKRREEGHIIRRAMELEVEARRGRGRPKKTWSSCIQEDLRKLNLREEDIHDRREWERLIRRPTPSLARANRDVKR